MSAHGDVAMIPQPATTLPFHQSLSPHLHLDNETCEWCGQEIPPEKLQEISGKIAAKEREQAQAITAKLERQHVIEKAQADAKAKADLELERQESAARETAGREEARQAAETAAAQKLEEAERVLQEQKAGLQQKLETADAARIAAEQAGVSLQEKLQQQLQESEAAIAAAKVEASAREAQIRAEAQSAAQVDVAEKFAAAERTRRLSEIALNAKITEIEATKTAAEQRGVTLQAQLDDLQIAKEAEIAKLKEDAATETSRILREAVEASQASLRDTLAEKDKALTEAQTKSAEAEGKLAQLSQQHEFALKQQLDAQRDILDKSKDDAVNAANAKAFEEKQKLQNQVNDLQRTLDKKSVDELGEGAEIDLYEALKAEFSGDCIERIGKGTAGADVRHVVLHNGRECGTIIYDSKNHKRFLNDHVTKLAQDQLAARAEHAILSTHKFPQGTRQLHLQDGVLLANPARVVAVVTLIRQHMIQTHTLRISSAERENKTAVLYAFITSERCTQLLGRIDTLTDDLLEQQVKERKWHDAAWKKEGEAIRSIQKAKAELSNEICSIIGTAPDDMLQLEEMEQ
jgi:hypothetical protein